MPTHPERTGEGLSWSHQLLRALALSALSQIRGDGAAAGAALGAGLNGFLLDLTSRASELSVSFTSHRCVVVSTDSASCSGGIEVFYTTERWVKAVLDRGWSRAGLYPGCGSCGCCSHGQFSLFT